MDAQEDFLYKANFHSKINVEGREGYQREADIEEAKKNATITDHNNETKTVTVASDGSDSDVIGEADVVAALTDIEPL